MFSKILRILVPLAVFLTVITSAFALNNEKSITITGEKVRVTVDGTEYPLRDANFNEVEPILCNGTTYVPLRAVSELLGKSVRWSEENREVIVGNGVVTDKDIQMGEKAIEDFFDHFSKGEFYEMKLLSSGQLSTWDFREGVYGMAEAKMTNCEILETKREKDIMVFLCSFDMVPTELSAFAPDPGQVSFSILVEKLNDQYMLSQFAGFI